MNFLQFFRLLLFPISLLYLAITWVRNKLYDWGILHSQQFHIPIISVGNITVGGTGKTPMSEYLLKILSENRHVALLSRGYKRKTKGFVLADESATATTIGDEPMQIFSKFKTIQVAVCENRPLGVQKLMDLPTPPQVILLDDAFQHRPLKPGFSILIMDYNRPLWHDCMMPTGNLREHSSGKKRADIVVVSKCPINLSADEASKIEKRLHLQSRQSIYFTTVEYGEPQFLTADHSAVQISPSDDLLIVTGIAKPQPFNDFVTQRFAKPKTILEYPDHHHFGDDDIHQMEEAFNTLSAEKKWIITTEKDAVRLREMLKDNLLINNILYIPIRISFLMNGEEKFNAKINQYVSTVH